MESLVQYSLRLAFLNFIFNFILSCFFLYLKVYVNEAECKQWRHERPISMWCPKWCTKMATKTVFYKYCFSPSAQLADWFHSQTLYQNVKF